MDISTTRHDEYGIWVRGSGEYASGNLFASTFILKLKISLTHSRNSKCNYGQEIRPGPPEYRGFHKSEVSKFETHKHIVDLSSERGRYVLQCRSPSGSHRRKA